jgi:hypothetical protein
MSSPGPGRQTTNDHKEYQHFMKSLEQKGPMPPQDNKLLAFQRALSAGTFASNGLVTIATGTNPAYTSPGCLAVDVLVVVSVHCTPRLPLVYAFLTAMGIK